MLVQVRLECKSLVTTRALEVLRRRMSLHVSPKVGPVGKRLLAYRATVGFMPRMRSHMALQ